MRDHAIVAVCEQGANPDADILLFKHVESPAVLEEEPQQPRAVAGVPKQSSSSMPAEPVLPRPVGPAGASAGAQGQAWSLTTHAGAGGPHRERRMDEQKLEDHVALFHVDKKEAELCSEWGIELHAGSQDLTYVDAVRLVKQTDRLYVSIPKNQQRRFLALVHSLRNAFGPDFWQRYPSPTYLTAAEKRAFPPHDHRTA